MKKIIGLSIVAICFAATSGYAQDAAPGGRQQGGRGAGRGGQQQPTTREDGLDPSPVNPAIDPNIDMFVNDYHNSKPHTEYGSLAVRDILTKAEGDPLHPIRRGAVLSDISSVSYATLAPGASASGRAPQGTVQIFFAVAGEGKITVNSKSYDLKDGVGFTLTPDFDFKLASTGKEPLGFYVRAQPVPANYKPSPDVVVVSRWDLDRRVGAHWVHTCNGGPAGMDLCTIPPHTMPQPHSHPGEEAWIMVKGETILSLGKNLRHMTAGQAYRIPPTGITAHSNINLSDEPVEMIYMGPLSRGGGPGGPPTGGAAAGGAPGRAQGGRGSGAPPPGSVDFARLDNSPISVADEFDIDMFMGNWRDSYPRMMHGNLYVRDMLTALQGSDPLHPERKGAVLTDATAVSYAMLEPGSTAHAINGELKDTQEYFVVNSGTGTIKSGSQSFDLSKGKAFVITPGLDFRMTATGDHYMTFYVVSQKLPEGLSAPATLNVVDNSTKPQVTKAWYDKERPLLTKSEGLDQYNALTEVELPSMTMSRPYSDPQGTEEIWIATDGDVNVLIGKELRKISAGTAYRVPSTGKTAHANINTSGTTAEFLYLATNNPLLPAGQ